MSHNPAPFFHRHPWLVGAALAAVLVLSGRAEAPHVYAITGARVVTAAGPVIDGGTVVVRDGFIEAVGRGVTVPADAVTIDGKGASVYPGLIDLGSSTPLSIPTVEAPRDPKTRMEVERARRQALLRAQVDAGTALKIDAPELKRFAAAGITSILATPPGDGIRGRSALVNVAAPADAPQIGQVADERRGLYVVRPAVGLHVSFPTREGGDSYPASLMGAIAFVRQAFIDAGHYQQQVAHYERAKTPQARPVYDPALEALQPALAGRLPVVFQAVSAVEIRRALGLAREFKLDALVAGALEADQAVAELKDARARVIYSLNYPTRPRTIAPEADEPVRVLRARSNASKVPAILEKAGVPFAFESAGLDDPRDFLLNAGKAVKAGLSEEAAVRALTLAAAKVAGVGDRLGSLEKGKIANLIVVEGGLFDEKVRVTHVFIDGRPQDLTK